jgi:entericidin B
MKKLFFAVASLIAVLSLSTCNTVQGIGKDIEQGGKTIEKAAK